MTKYKFYRDIVGEDKSLPELERQALKNAGVTKEQINEAWRQFLTNEGIASGALPTMQTKWLRSLGYEGNLSQMLQQMYISGNNPFNPLGPVKDAAHMWVDKDTPYTGTASAITGLQPEGLLPIDFSVMAGGAGEEIEVVSDGIKFNGGKWLRKTGLSGTYDEATLVIQYTPHEFNGTMALIDSTLSSKLQMRIISNRPQALMPDNATHSYSITGNELEKKVTLVINIDFINKTYMAVDSDGLETSGSLDPSTTAMTILTFDLGNLLAATIHRMGLYLAETGETLPYTATELWELVGDNPKSKYIPGVIEYHWEIGQSLSTGTGPDVPTRDALGFENRLGAVMPTGLENTVGTPTPSHGPQISTLNQSVAATGLIPVEVGKAPPRFLSALTSNKFRDGLDLYRHATMCTGMPGQPADEFDNDMPTVTGLLGTMFLDNTEYVANEIKRLALLEGEVLTIPTLSILQGTADQLALEGEYFTNMSRAIDDNLASIFSITGDVPRLMVYQTGGDNNTANTDYHNVKMDQLALVEHYGGTLVMPIYGLETEDGLHPNFESSRKMADIWNWARAEVDRGNSWNLIPSTTLDGTTITVTATCRPDESLTVSTDIYGGQGIDNYGFEVDGANITSVVVSGNTVIISCDGVPTELRYAMQSRDSTGDTGPLFSSHKGLIQTTLTHTVDGRVLIRSLPSFKESF